MIEGVRLKKRWRLAKPAPREFFEEFPEFHPVVLQLLFNRKIVKEEEIEKFLNPDWERDLYDPFLMQGMAQAVRRIKRAFAKKEKVAIVGHFDVDGVTSAALLYLVFKKMGLVPSVYIPDRCEGYGLTQQAITTLSKEKTNLLITVDTGISAAKEIELVKKAGMDVIVTDHHKPPDHLPKAKAILNPHQKNCSYPFGELAGVGVAFKLAQALLRTPTHLPFPKQSVFLKWLTDLVALGTICDVVPLISENRLFAKFGLIVLNKTKNLGLRQLCQVANLLPGNIDVYATSFILGPRLNAPGRIDHANASFYLLTTTSLKQAEKMALLLDAHNRERQRILERVFAEAKKEVEEKGLLSKKIIMLGKEDWPSGIIGLIAGKLVGQYYRPAVVLQIGEKQSRGSGRSIESFHLTQALEEVSAHLLQFGGHKRAAGFSVLTDKIEDLKRELVELAEKRISSEDITPAIEIDAEINLEQVDWSFWEELEKFEPTGYGNEKPVFLAKKVKIEEVKTVGRKKEHLKMKLAGLEAIFFNQGEPLPKIQSGDVVDLVFHILVDEWNAHRRLQLKIIDLKPSLP